MTRLYKSPRRVGEEEEEGDTSAAVPLLAEDGEPGGREEDGPAEPAPHPHTPVPPLTPEFHLPPIGAVDTAPPVASTTDTDTHHPCGSSQWQQQHQLLRPSREKAHSVDIRGSTAENPAVAEHHIVVPGRLGAGGAQLPHLSPRRHTVPRRNGAPHALLHGHADSRRNSEAEEAMSEAIELKASSPFHRPVVTLQETASGSVCYQSLPHDDKDTNLYEGSSDTYHAESGLLTPE